MQNKKGYISLIAIGIGVIFLLVAIIASTGALATSATSFTQKKVGCDSPTLQAKVSGDFVVVDGAVIGVEPEVKEISNIGISSFSLSLQGFNYEVELFDSTTGVKLDSYKNAAKLDNSAKDMKIPFALNYKTPDNNCDGKVDDTRLTVKVTTVETDDLVFKDTSVKSFDYNVQNGVIVR